MQAQGLPRSPADETSAQLNYVVDLQSLDENRLGEQLSAIWEHEVGPTVTVIAPWRGCRRCGRTSSCETSTHRPRMSANIHRMSAPYIAKEPTLRHDRA